MYFSAAAGEQRRRWNFVLIVIIKVIRKRFDVFSIRANHIVRINGNGRRDEPGIIWVVAKKENH